MTSFADRLRLTLLTARRAGIRRTAARVRRIFLLRAVYPRFAARLYPSRPIPLPTSLERVPPLLRRACSEWDGTISLLHTTPFPVHPPVAWDANPAGQTLWQFRLHEWDWAYPLIHTAQTDPHAAAELAALVRDYAARVPFGHSTADEPYPLSRRLVIWCEALRILSPSSADPDILRTLAAEMDRGARMLAQNLETDLDNNHLIANAKALAFVGTILEQPYAAQGFSLLWKQLRAQVRPDGLHIENSTSYHFLVWRDAIETCLLARAFDVPIPTDIPTILSAMSDALSVICYPDGTFPLLNDSVADEFPARRELWAANFSAKNSPPTMDSAFLFSHAGYAVLRAPDVQLVFDAGALGPTFCPGHGHADTLSFELFALGKLRLVDPGTYQYQAGEWRDYFRGTAAHNTLQVDGANSSEVSDSFKVGRMANASLWTEGTWLCGTHDGYTRLAQPVTHTRRIKLETDRTLRIRDEITGQGEHSYVLHFHLAPDAAALVVNNTATVRFADDVTLSLEIANGPGALERIDGWYSPTWNIKSAAPVLTYSWRGTPPFEISTTIAIHTR